MEFKSVSKKAILNMLIAAGVSSFLIVLAFLIVWFAFLMEMGIGLFLTALYWLILFLVCSIPIVSPFVRYNRYKYQINDVRVAVKEGLIFLTTEIAPIERVHQISVMQGPIDRLTGLAKVVITTAGGKITVRFLEKELAEDIAAKLENTIKTIVAKQGETYER